MSQAAPVVCFRVDAGNRTGTGHLMEVVSILKNMRRRLRFRALAVVNEHPLCREKLAPLTDALEVLDRPDGAGGEVAALDGLLRRHGAGCVVADLLDRTPAYYGALLQAAGRSYVVLDTSTHEEVPATVAVNFNITQSPDFYAQARAYPTEYLIGPAYAPLDDELVAEWGPRIAFRERVGRIFVNQGGSDPFGLTAKTLRALETLGLAQEVDVVVGGALTDEHRRELSGLRPALRGRYRFFENIPHRQVCELLSAADLALTAAGNTLYEIAFFGVPAIVISHHEKHDQVAKRFAASGAAVDLGIGTGLSEAAIAAAVRAAIADPARRQALSESGRRLVDGRGLERLTERIRKDLEGRDG